MLSRLLIDNEVSIFGGPLHGTVFSLDGACPQCGTGARQVGPLMLSTHKLPKLDIFALLTGEVLVSPSFSDQLTDAGFRCLGPVLRAQDQTRLPAYQLIPERELPPFVQQLSAVVRERPCSNCQRDGFFDKPTGSMQLVYDALDSLYLSSDLLATFERFGNSRLREPLAESVFARPALIVGERFQEVVAANPVRGISLEQVVMRDRQGGG